jgi:hypothetical protein
MRFYVQASAGLEVRRPVGQLKTLDDIGSMQQLTYKFRTKSINGATPGGIVRSEKWVMSRRDWLKIYDDRVTCGDWDILYSTVSDAVLYKGFSFPWPARVL